MIIWLFVLACAPPDDDPGVVDETGYLTDSLILQTSPAEGDGAVFVGLTSLLAPGGDVRIVNLTTGEDGVVVRGDDGDMIAPIAASAGDAILIEHALPDLLLSAELTVADPTLPNPTSYGPVTGPLFPLPEEGMTEMDLRQTTIGAPFSLFNEDNGATLFVTSADPPPRISAQAGDSVCYFTIDAEEVSPYLCDTVSDQEKAP